MEFKDSVPNEVRPGGSDLIDAVFEVTGVSKSNESFDRCLFFQGFQGKDIGFAMCLEVEGPSLTEYTCARKRSPNNLRMESGR